jgi:hypothetical protein
MVPISTRKWEWIEARSPTLFLVGGGLVVVYAGLHGLEAATDLVLEPNPFEFGYVVGFLGLLGLYPALADETPWLARAGAAAAVLGIIGLSAFTVLHLAELAGIVARGGPAWFWVFIPLPLIGFVVGYLSIGIASLRTGVHTQMVGLLLLAPGIIVVVMLVQMLAGWTSQLQAFVISAGEAMAHLAIGATLKTKFDSDRGEPSSHGDREMATHD